MRKATKIGNVKLSYLNQAEGPEYSDGDVEDELLLMFKDELSEERRDEILAGQPSWPIRYHISKERGNLINWYDFPKGSRILEVGSGCGAITEALVKNSSTYVVANELSERRAMINAHRNQKASNLEVVVGNLQDFKPEQKFDFVVCVGVLEYAGEFIKGENPYNKFLEMLASFLTPEGVLLLAIENRLGFKYLSGAKEDHTGGYYDGINNYPQKKNVRTFGRNELSLLLAESGLTVDQFYYPHPDYKLPSVVYSDRYLPGVHTTIPKTLLPSPSFDQTRKVLFSEQLFLDAIEDNRVYQDFSNSFLVEARIGLVPNAAKEKVVFGLTRVNRNNKHSIRTTAIQRDGTLFFKKEALNEQSIPHVNRLLDTYKILDKIAVNSKNIFISKPINENTSTGSVEFNYIAGENAENALIKCIINDDYVSALKIYKKYKAILDEFSENSIKKTLSVEQKNIFGETLLTEFKPSRVITSGILDFNLDNFIIDETNGDWWLIDYEWRVDVAIPTEFIEYRGMLAFFSRYRDMIMSRCIRKEIISNGVLALPKELMSMINYETKKLDSAYKVENNHIQSWILGKKFSVEAPGKYISVSPQENFIDQADRLFIEKDSSIIELRNENIKQNKEIKELTEHVENLVHRISQIEASTSFRIVKKVAGVKGRVLHRRNIQG